MAVGVRTIDGAVRATHARRARRVAPGGDAQRLLDVVADAPADLAASYWRLLGWRVVGPLLVGFARFVVDDARARGVRRIAFLSRDGHLPKLACRSYAPEIDHRYIYASRRMFLFALLSPGDDLGGFTDTPNGTTALDVARRLGLDIDEAELRDLVAAHAPPDAPLMPGRDPVALRIVESLRPRVEERARVEHDAVRAYVAAEGLDDDHVGVVDVGWYGSTQARLERLLGREYAGWYVGLRHDAPAPARCASYLAPRTGRGRWTERLYDSIEMHEFLFTAPHAQALTVRREGAGFAPMLAPVGDAERARQAIARELEAGATAFVDRAPHDLAALLARAPALAAAGLHALMLHPAPDDLAAWTQARHVPALGAGAPVPILPERVSLLDLVAGRRRVGTGAHTAWPVGVVAQAGVRLPEVFDEPLATALRRFVVWRSHGTADLVATYAGRLHARRRR